MARRIVVAIARLMRERHTDEVHIHAGPHGRPYVCEDPRCTSPSM